MDMALVVSMFSTAFALMALAFSVFKNGKSTQMDALGEEVAALKREVAELRRQGATPPPLPRARAGHLDDLREQLRASASDKEEDARLD